MTARTECGAARRSPASPRSAASASNRLLAANGWSNPRELARGEIVHIPMPASRAEASGTAAQVAAATSAPAEATVVSLPPAPREPVLQRPAGKYGIAAGAEGTRREPRGSTALLPAQKEPVSERQAEGTALLPAAAPTGSVDTTDYSVGADNTVVVQAGETLGHYADWSKVSAASLLRTEQAAQECDGDARTQGQTGFVQGERRAIRSDAARISSAAAGDFFCRPRISGTENYVVKHGESLWIIAQQHRGFARLAGGRIQPGRGFQRCSTGHHDCAAPGRSHQSPVMPRECR